MKLPKLPKFKLPTGRWTSRKFIIAIFAALFPVFNEAYGWNISEEAIMKLFLMCLGYIGVEGTADVATRIMNGKK